jgi:hypothetical protein
MRILGRIPVDEEHPPFTNSTYGASKVTTIQPGGQSAQHCT